MGSFLYALKLVFLWLGLAPAARYFVRLADLREEDWRDYDVIILDVDNTLTHHGSCHLIPAATRLITALHAAGKTVYLHSNCPTTMWWEGKRERLTTIARSHNVRLMACFGLFGLRAKPRPYGYRQIREDTGKDFSKMLVIGDQQFTDVCGAHRQGITAYYVRPCGSDRWYNAYKRPLEKGLFLIIRPTWRTRPDAILPVERPVSNLVEA